MQAPSGSGTPTLEPVATPPASLSDYAAWLAREHVLSARPARQLVPRLRQCERVLRAAHAVVAQATARGEVLTPDGEWLLDNFYVVESVLREVRKDLPRDFYAELPTLVSGTAAVGHRDAGLPRVYGLALGLLVATEGNLDERVLVEFIHGYQQESVLTIGELWAFPVILRIALIENLAHLAERMLAVRQQYDAARAWVQTAHAATPPGDRPGDPFLVGLLRALREQTDLRPETVEAVQGLLSKTGVDPAELYRREHHRQAANQVAIGTCITNLRLLGVLDWSKFVEQTSRVEEILRAESTGLYVRQDFATRDAHRKAVERFARGSKKSETDVARAVVEAAGDEASDGHAAFVGHYLIGDGQDEFGARIGYRPRWRDARRRWIHKRPGVVYFGLLATFTLGLIAAVVVPALALGWLPATLLGLVAVLPASEIAVGLVNFVACRLVPPRVLPKLDFSRGIADDCATCVVIPGMLVRPESGVALTRQLERHYLSNSDDNLRYALLTDYADAPAQSMPEDADLLRVARREIDRLNAQYPHPDAPRFLLLHRKRTWNTSENCWMGWERKRGKLQQFNHWLRGGSEEPYEAVVGDRDELPHVRFVLTLDADTVLPRDAAHLLVGTLAHPLNKAVLSADGRRVVAGYGVLQPRVSFLLSAGQASAFAAVHAASAGIDPYSAAVSDAYMDLFGRGTFTGKGLYDVDAFEATAGTAFPENAILSHDLIECNFARCGLASDIEVFDGFPARYPAYARREHRWVRGDWQLLPWLGRTVPTAKAGRQPNPLPVLERWKIVDNLRRSLVPPALVLGLALSWIGVVPFGPMLGLVLAVLFLPAALLLVNTAQRMVFGGAVRAGWAHARAQFGPTVAQGVLTGVFLAEQTAYLLDAVSRTLGRLYVTRKRLLVWEASAVTERRIGGGVLDFFVNMRGGLALVVVLALLVWFVPEANLWAAVPWLVVWAFAPLVAYLVSRPAPPPRTDLTEVERRKLRALARRTWDFFETFVGPADHWLPPDNFQEIPQPKVAHRTSPTNMGLLLASTLAAHDLGYVPTPILATRLARTLETFDRLTRYRGHFLNWYDTRSLVVLEPGYVSTVDSGNLLACLIVLKHGLAEKLKEPVPSPRAIEGFRDLLALAEETGPVRGLIDGPEPTTPSGWLRLLDQLVAVPETKTVENWRWMSRLRELAQQRRDELLAAYPWLPELAAWRDKGASPELLAELDKAASLSDLVQNLPRWREAYPAGADVFDRCQAKAMADELRRIIAHAESFIEPMDFRWLYNPERELFALGYHLPRERLDQAHYDLLASEAAIASFLAIARGHAPRKHWFHLGRLFTHTAGRTGLLSWAGTMFEYLTPRLFLPAPAGTLLDAAQHAAVRRQIEYGQELGLPWGVSESGFNLMDGQSNYQYQAFGVPGLGLKRGLAKDRVIAPYATAMAVGIDPRAVLANLAHLEKVGGLGPYGLYEAIDYTPDRHPVGKPGVVVQSYMAHHQGMGFIAIANALLGDPMPKRLLAEPAVRATELLLQERLPDAPISVEVPEEEERTAGDGQAEGVSRRLTTANTPAPRTHLLSNGRYSVLLTNAGGGYSAWNGVEVTRWRADATRDAHGHYFYLREAGRPGVRAATAQPLGDAADAYEVVYSIDKAEFQRRHDDLETLLEVVVPPDTDAEVRRLTLVNHATVEREIEVTSFAEVALAHPGADRAHPAFQKLFVQTEWVAEVQGLLAGRRPRQAGDATPWAAHLVVTDMPVVAVEYETDRAKFLGRRRTAANPAALADDAGPLSGTVGPVLDPAFGLRVRVRVAPGCRCELAFVTAAAGSRDDVLRVARQMHAMQAVAKAFELAWAHARVELWDLKVAVRDVHLYQRLAGHLLYPGPTLRAPASTLAANRQGQAGLWRHGISGDLPIVLVRTQETPEDLELVKHLLAAHSYWRLRGLAVDLVVVSEAPASYQDNWNAALMTLIRTTDARDYLDRPGGVFLRKADHFAADDLTLLATAARAVFAGDRGTLADQVAILEPRRKLPAPLRPSPTVERRVADRVAEPTREALQFFNGLGGFSGDGTEYVLPAARTADAVPAAPWVNVVANPGFGCLVSDSGLGYTWAGNSQLNRLTPWSNDPVIDPPSAAVYLRDEETGEVWSPTPLPCGGPTEVRHGQGYTRFHQRYAGIEQEMDVFVAADDPVQIVRLRVRNRRRTRCRLTATFFVEWVLGAQREQTGPYILTEEDGPTGALLARNPFSLDFPGTVAFVDVLQRPRSFTGDRDEFLGRNGTYAAPAALKRVGLSGWAGAGADPCGAVQTLIDLEPGAETVVVFLLGQGRDLVEARQVLGRYRTPAQADAALTLARRRWEELLTAVQVETPDLAFDLLVNRWLLYQVAACRLWGRTGFYQSGGAYGFRDQLQDVMALVVAAPARVREQIVRASGRQFAQGDVQHWWHPPAGRGVRTRFSDDFLWLPFVAAHYVEATGDIQVLDEVVPFLTAPGLEATQHEVYAAPQVGPETGTVYEHCVRALDNGWKLGEHGLPLMGIGDWNDGMNHVGIGGKGESVWLAWFQIACYKAFLPLAERRKDAARVAQWKERVAALTAAAEEHAWDGGWYRRAYFDDGTPLGSAANDECQIDSLAQSWAALCGAADPERARHAVHAAVNQLVKPAERLVLLFQPPFDKTELDPGYIKGYVPGVRENGGQYTHAACWLVQALAELGEADLAYRVFDLLNPIHHADRADRESVYRIEPYVVAGDVYGAPPHAGRGGWSWYTGAAGWLYQVAVFTLLGIRVRGDRLRLCPRLPAAWPWARATLRVGRSVYLIGLRAGAGPAPITLDGQAVEGEEVVLVDDGREHHVSWHGPCTENRN